jgi:thiol:disulfide interchange protein/DsbC/DsbD-like thiol-disulfide interchange protein
VPGGDSGTICDIPSYVISERMLRWITLLLLIASAQAQVYQGKTIVTASLVSDTSAIVPGKPFEVGVLLEMAPGWHTYWEYPGDAGLPTSIAWTLPDGFVAGPIQWPLPHRVIEPGDIEVYAYKDKVLLLTAIVPPTDITERTVTLRAKVDWLVCEQICIPGSADLELSLPLDRQAVPANEELFSAFRRLLPAATAPPYQLAWSREGNSLVLNVTGLEKAKEVDLFPLPGTGEQIEHPRNGPVRDGAATITVAHSGDLRGVLVVETESDRKGWIVSSSEQLAPRGPPSPSVSSPTASWPGLWQALIFGFLGGFILNLMPCVLPVISLKIFGFIRQAGDHPEEILRHGLAFVAGIFAWFLGLGLVILGLKAAGSEVTWAFQFQNPWFNLIIGCIVFVFALNLFGVFEIVLPGRASTALAEASSQQGYAGSFFQGIFATLLATPCTAPFLGTALGFAFSQSPIVILAMFGSVALGMSAPYFFLSAKPGWMKLLPKPGEWMERVKQFMGFPLLATLLWLLYILGNQRGHDAVIWIAAFLLCLAVACWIYGAFCGPLSSPRARVISLAVIALILFGGARFFLAGKFARLTAPGAVASPTEGIAWKPFSQKALDDLLKAGEPVFVDFTADWCISCKFNERTAINVPAVQEAFAKNGIVPMKADWTNANPEITAALKKFGRVGVPFYVLYPRGRAGEPIILPEILTENIVLEAISKAGQ